MTRSSPSNPPPRGSASKIASSQPYAARCRARGPGSTTSPRGARSRRRWSGIGSHLDRWRLVYISLAVLAILYGVSRWAAYQNARRDAGITWLDVSSARTMQSYTVRAQVDHGQLQAFTLEAGDRYTFRDCAVPSPGSDTSCTDLAGNAWTIEP